MQRQDIILSASLFLTSYFLLLTFSASPNLAFLHFVIAQLVRSTRCVYLIVLRRLTYKLINLL